MAGDIAVVIEHSAGEIERLSLRLLAKGRALADRRSAGLVALLVGEDTGRLAELIQASGPDEIAALDISGFETALPQEKARAMARMATELAPSLILTGYTFFGMEGGPALASCLGLNLVSNCVDVEWTGSGWILTRSMFEGFYHVSIEADSETPLMVSLQPAAVRNKLVQSPLARVRRFGAEPAGQDQRMKVISVLQPALGGIDINKADVIVTAGRGIGNAGNLKLIEELAEALGGVVAGSRPVVDLGWLEKGRLVGISGKTVSPRVYITCGVSGAAQHVAGMSGSARIVAIDKNPNAPIFQVAHYGIVGDLFQIVPEIIREAKGQKSA